LKAFDTLISCSEGDLRRAITYLQYSARLKKGGMSCIKSSDVLEIAGVVRTEAIENLLDTCLTNSFEKVEAEAQVNKPIV
jgi:replication factor C subunit 2/4